MGSQRVGHDWATFTFTQLRRGIVGKPSMSDSRTLSLPTTLSCLSSPVKPCRCLYLFISGRESWSPAKVNKKPMGTQQLSKQGLELRLLSLKHWVISFTHNTWILGIRKCLYGTSLVVQWLGIYLPMQGTWVRSLLWEDSTNHGATKPMSDNYGVHTLEHVICNKKDHCCEKTAHSN